MSNSADWIELTFSRVEGDNIWQSLCRQIILDPESMQLEIARTMEISPDMVLRMAHDLTSKGYLQEISIDCAEPQKGCPDCPVNSTCQVVVKHWFLTEKGKAAVSGRISDHLTGKVSQ